MSDRKFRRSDVIARDNREKRVTRISRQRLKGLIEEAVENIINEGYALNEDMSPTEYEKYYYDWLEYTYPNHNYLHPDVEPEPYDFKDDYSKLISHDYWTDYSIRHDKQEMLSALHEWDINTHIGYDVYRFNRILKDKYKIDASISEQVIPIYEGDKITGYAKGFYVCDDFTQKKAPSVYIEKEMQGTTYIKGDARIEKRYDTARKRYKNCRAVSFYDTDTESDLEGILNREY